MPGLSDAFENKVLDHLFGGPALAQLGTVYVALVTAAVGDTDTGSTITEANYTGYGRIAVAVGDWRAALAGAKKNLNALNFGQCTAGASTTVGFAVCTAASGGDVVMAGSLPSTAISVNITPSFGTDALVLNAD